MFRRVCAGLALLVLAGCTSDSGGSTSASPSASAAAPVLAADFAAASRKTGLLGYLPGAKELDPKAAVLTGPTYSYELTGAAGLTGTIPAAIASALSVEIGTVVPAGRQLFLVEIDRWLGTDPAPGFAAVVGDAELPERPPNALKGTVGFAVPTGTAPVLKVTDAGRTQSIDLSTGRRGRDAIAGFHPVRRGEWASGDASTSIRLSGPGVAGLSTAERLATVAFQSVDAELQPYVEGRGWARPGRAWLVLETEIGYGRPAADYGRPDSVEVRPSSLTGSGPGAPRIVFGGDPIRIGAVGSPSEDSVLTADVPAGLRQVTLTFQFRGTVETTDGPVSFQAYTKSVHTAELRLA